MDAKLMTVPRDVIEYGEGKFVRRPSVSSGILPEKSNDGIVLVKVLWINDTDSTPNLSSFEIILEYAVE